MPDKIIQNERHDGKKTSRMITNGGKVRKTKQKDSEQKRQATNLQFKEDVNNKMIMKRQ